MHLTIKSIIPIPKNPQMVRVVAEGVLDADSVYQQFDVGDMLTIGEQTHTIPAVNTEPKRRINTRDSILNSEKS